MEIIAPATIISEAAGASLGGGTYYDRNGVLQTAAPGALRVTYDPADLSAAPYVLIEPAATQRFAYTDIEASTVGTLPAGLSVAAYGVAVTSTDITPPYGTKCVKHTYTGSGGQDTNVGVKSFASPDNMYFATGLYLFIPATFNGTLLSVVVEHASVSSYTTGTGTASAVDLTKRGVWQRVEIRGFVSTVGGGVPLVVRSDSASPVYTCGWQAVAGTAPVSIGSFIPNATAGFVTRNADSVSAAVGLLYSNIVESDANDGPLWAASAYAVGAKVRRPNHRVYQALQATTASGAAPETLTGGTTPTWLDVGPTKRWSVFDNKYATLATATDEITYVIRPNSVATAVAALGLDGADVRVSMVDAAGSVVYRSTKVLRLKNSKSITDYMFRPISRRRDEVFDDLPPFKSGTICVTVRKPGSTAAVADIVVGRLENIGDTQWKPEIRTLRRSKIDDDGFGNVTFIKRRSSKLITADVSLSNDRVDDVVRLLDNYTDTPCVIIGDTRWTSLIVLGFVQDFRLVLESPAGSLYNAQIQGFA